MVSESVFCGALEGAPESWKYTPVLYKGGFVDQWNKKPLSIHEAIRLGTNYINPTKEDPSPITLTGLGLHLGKFTKTGCFDFDQEKLSKEEIEKKFKEWFKREISELPKSISWTSGKPNRYQIAFEIPENYWDLLGSHNSPPELPEMELRWDKLQSVLPPSKHPETGSYKWINSPKDVPLAKAPEWFLEGWAKLSEKEIKPKKRKFIDFKYKRTRDELDYDSSRVEEGLKVYCQDHKYITYSKKPNYDPWKDIGMTLHCLSKEWEELTDGKIVDLHLDDWILWSKGHENYDPNACLNKWNNDFKEDGGLKFGTFIDYCESNPKHKNHKEWLRRRELWEELEKLEPTKEPPKRKRDDLLNDIFEAAVRGDNNTYFEDFAEMETRFRRKQSDIAIDLLVHLREKFNKKVFSVGEVDMSKVDSLEYLLEGYVLKGEVGILYAPFATGKTSLACGMIRAGFNKVGFLDQVRKRDRFESLFIMSDGGASRFTEVYNETGLKPEMVKVWAADLKQGKTNWKCNLRGLIKLHKYLKNRPQTKLVFIDSVISMMSNSGFKYVDNEMVDLMVQFLREIICEPLGVSIILLSHVGTDGVSSSGAKRWVGACGWAGQIKPVTNNGTEDFKKRKLCIWKDPINGKRVFDYKVDENGLFIPVYNSDMKGDAFGELKQYLQQINFATGRKVFDAKDFHQITYSTAQVNRALKEHWESKYGILKKQRNKDGEVVRGKYVLKTQYILLNDDNNQQKPIADSDFWKT